MMRWRVKASRRTPTWFSACEVTFLDALDAFEAKRQIEAQSTLGTVFEVWAVTPATVRMEEQHADWLRRCEEWRRRASTAEASRGML
jgi:hypothetical protein